MTLATRITALATAVGADVKSLNTQLVGKQGTLVSGTNIKTVNGTSVMGSGNVSVPTVALDGPISMVAGESTTYTITDWSSFSVYSVTASAGTATITGNSIAYTAPAGAQTATLTVTRDGMANTFAIGVAKPAYEATTPEPTPGEFGAPLEGGFYAGMIWNQATQSTTSTTIATGVQTFAVADMSAEPFAYVGQQLAVRSRANPANKMAGTVSAITATTLTMSITAVGGSGTFNDWSIMARFRIIVAPKASGENAGIALKNATTAMPVATQTLSEGWLATNAMRNADTSTVYPAAHWARSLNIGGRTDWYIPARDELELCWRNLKPTTHANYVVASRPVSAYNYATLGAYGDTATTYGLNPNSAPAGAAYTTTDPAQVANTAFRTGGAEAFTYGNGFYWSSSESIATHAWLQYWYSSAPGGQVNVSKTSTHRVRAVRRSPL